MIPLPPTQHGVRFKTELCDEHGNVERVLREGHNTITDWGMDQLASKTMTNLLAYLHLGTTADTRKRVGDGVNELTPTVTDASDVDISTVSNFFEAGDVGRVLKIVGWPELVIDAYTDPQNVHCHARGDVWLPGFTPGSGPFTDFGVHYTNVATLAAQFTKFNTFDTGAAGYNSESNDSANSRTILKRIWLSSVVSGSPWTIQQVGWSDGNGSNNCFGIANLGGTDAVAVGKRYRLTLEAYVAYTPIDLSGVSCNWGPDVGTISCDIRQERIGWDGNDGFEGGGSSSPNGLYNFLRPFKPTSHHVLAWTSAFTMAGAKWYGDSGFDFTAAHGTVASSYNAGAWAMDGSYTSGTHQRTRTARWPEIFSFTNATGIAIGALWSTSAYWVWLTVKPVSGTITKASDTRIDLIFNIHWTRELLN